MAERQFRVLSRGPEALEAEGGLNVREGTISDRSAPRTRRDGKAVIDGGKTRSAFTAFAAAITALGSFVGFAK